MNDKFFTKIQNLPLDEIKDYLELNSNTYYLEPSVGTGELLKLIPNENVICIDLYPESHLNIPVIKCDFLEMEFNFNEYITIMNPPFGKNSRQVLACKIISYKKRRRSFLYKFLFHFFSV